MPQDTGTGNLDFHSLLDLRNEMNNDFGGAFGSITLNDTTGAIDFTTGAAARRCRSRAPTRRCSRPWPRPTAPSRPTPPSRTDQFSHVATETDLAINLRNGLGANLGLANGDNISLAANKGGTAIAVGNPVLTVVGGATNYGQLLAAIDTSLGITNISGAAITAGTGALSVTGDGGTANALTGLNIQSSGAGAAGFNAIFGSLPGNYIEQQVASDVSHDVAITAYDSIGNPIDLSIKFTKDPTAQNRWLWQATAPAPANITGGGDGAVTFDSNGRLETFTYTGGAEQPPVRSGHRSALDPVDVNLDSGSLGQVRRPEPVRRRRRTRWPAARTATRWATCRTSAWTSAA